MERPESYSLVFHRKGQLNLTKRWKDGEFPAVKPEDWDENDKNPQEIRFTEGFCQPLQATVRLTKVREGDSTGRRWTDRDGRVHWVRLPSYAIADISAFQASFVANIEKHAEAWAAKQGLAHKEALRLAKSSPDAKYMIDLLRYDFARWQKTGSDWVVGPNKLGIPELPPDNRTMPGQSPLPRLITAQQDNITDLYIDRIFDGLFGRNGSFIPVLLSDEPRRVHEAYVALRVIVDGCVWILRDKHRRDVQNGSTDYTLQEDIQRSLNYLIATFTGKHRGVDYGAFSAMLTKEERAYHRTIEEEVYQDDACKWTSPLYWLPPMEELFYKCWDDRKADWSSLAN